MTRAARALEIACELLETEIGFGILNGLLVIGLIAVIAPPLLSV